jgi:hypothetical protein
VTNLVKYRQFIAQPFAFPLVILNIITIPTGN